MSAENDNNTANYEEIEGHVKVLSAKLSQMTQNNSGVQSGLEDLTDYYERAIQLRMMRVQTLEELLREKEVALKTSETNTRTLAYAFALILAISTALKNPSEAIEFVYFWWSYIAVALGAFGLARAAA